MKKVFAGVALLVVLVAAALWYVIDSLDALVETAIERYGSEAAGVSVAVGAVRISLRDGEGSIEDLVVGSPEGFRADNTFELGEIHIALDTATLTSDPVVIEEIRIEAPRVTYEWGARKSNVAVIQKNVNDFAARHTSGSARSASEPEASGKAEPRFIIDELIVRGGSVVASAALIEGSAKQTALPDLHVKGLGRKQGGATASEIAVEILNALAANAVRGAAGANLDALQEQGKRAAEKAIDDALEGLFQR